MIQNFNKAFTYVNEHYVYNEANYPILSKLSVTERKIFSLNHGLLHILKSANDLSYIVPLRREDVTRRLDHLAKSSDVLGTRLKDHKIAMLKMVVNVLSIAHVSGFTESEVSDFIIPTDEELAELIPYRHIGIANFPETVAFFIKKLAIILEKADHTGELDDQKVQDLIKALYLSMIHWFDAEWLPDFLAQIPDVMKSKQEVQK